APVLLSASDAIYDTSIFFIGLVYRVTALVLCLCGYVFMFYTIRRKGARAEFKILLHGVCLVVVLTAVIISSFCIRYRIGASYRLIRAAFLTLMLWIPCTNILVTIYTTKSLHSRIFNPLLPDKTSVAAMIQLHRTSTRSNAWQTYHKS
uniref:G protein-coupled receptor n=1 Tax=Haemonchus contortus TaxID=6289 RepID=A0A7I5EBS3_HAECO